MEKFNGKMNYEGIKELLGSSLVISLFKEPELFWFRIKEVGKDPAGTVYIKGYDSERLNHYIYVRDIETIYTNVR